MQQIVQATGVRACLAALEPRQGGVGMRGVVAVVLRVVHLVPPNAYLVLAHRCLSTGIPVPLLASFSQYSHTYYRRMVLPHACLGTGIGMHVYDLAPPWYCSTPIQTLQYASHSLHITHRSGPKVLQPVFYFVCNAKKKSHRYSTATHQKARNHTRLSVFVDVDIDNPSGRC